MFVEISSFLISRKFSADVRACNVLSLTSMLASDQLT
jgi:hypothetical protein